MSIGTFQKLNYSMILILRCFTILLKFYIYFARLSSVFVASVVWVEDS